MHQKNVYLFTLEFVGPTKLYLMKKILIAIIAIIALAATEGFLTTLNITKGKAHMAIWDSFSYGNYAGPTAKTYHSFAIPLRVAMVKEIGSFAIAYIVKPMILRRDIQSAVKDANHKGQSLMCRWRS